MISTPLCVNFSGVSGVFPRNRLTAEPLPPSDTSDVVFVLGSGMNRLAAMNICQVARCRSRLFDVI